MRQIDFGLYLITDRKLFADDESLYGAVEAALGAGVKAVQLREKDIATRKLLDMAYRLRDITERFGTRFFVNDRADIALCVNADGVHLGTSSIPVSAARRVLGERFLIGVSTHGTEEAVRSEAEGADFITFGPLFPTSSKLRYGAPVGIGVLRSVRQRCSLPIFGIGGIKVHHIAEVINSGADGIALISGILGQADVGSAASDYVSTLQESLNDRRRQDAGKIQQER